MAYFWILKFYRNAYNQFTDESIKTKDKRSYKTTSHKNLSNLPPPYSCLRGFHIFHSVYSREQGKLANIHP